MFASLWDMKQFHVLEALFGFEGVEFYMKQWPELIGVRFGEILRGLGLAEEVPFGVTLTLSYLITLSDQSPFICCVSLVSPLSTSLFVKWCGIAQKPFSSIFR